MSRMDFLVESSGEWELGRETVTVGVVEVDVATAAVGAAARRVRGMVGLPDELKVLSVRLFRGRIERRDDIV